MSDPSLPIPSGELKRKRNFRDYSAEKIARDGEAGRRLLHLWIAFREGLKEFAVTGASDHQRGFLMGQWLTIVTILEETFFKFKIFPADPSPFDAGVGQ